MGKVKRGACGVCCFKELDRMKKKQEKLIKEITSKVKELEGIGNFMFELMNEVCEESCDPK